MNIVQLAMDQLSPPLIGKIVGALGTDRTTAQSALGAAVPAILAGLVGLVQKPGGSDQLAALLQHADAGMASWADSLIGSGQQQALIEQGSGMLASLLGGSTVNALAAAVGRFAGLGGGQASSLLGITAPIVLGMLRGQQQRQGLDASGLAGLLLGQRDAILHALPAGFASLLQSTGLLGSVGAPASQAGAGAARSTPAAALQPAPAAGRGWPLPALLAAAVAIVLLGYWWLADRGAPPVATAPIAPDAASTAAPTDVTPLMVGEVDLGARLNGVLERATGALGSVSDAASAEAALPGLEQLNTELQEISALAGQLPDEGRTALAGLVGTALPALQGLLDKAMAIPAVAAVLGPVIEPLKAKLDELAAA
jgi:hypothetical protein